MSDHAWSDGLLESGFGDADTATVVGWPARVARMVDVEAALARALAHVGLLEPDQSAAVVAACDVSRLDLDELARRAATAASPVIPLVAALAAKADETGAAWLHHGATSQDIVDTAAVLQLRGALDRLETLLGTAADHCADLADRHRDTVMAGRTLGQQAVPITFGLKAARWLGALDRHLDRLRSLRRNVEVMQLGGVAGTLAVYGDRGSEVAAALAAELHLGVPDLPWHAERDRIVEVTGYLAGVASTAGSVATDLVLLAQPEVGEVREAKGAGPTSSAAPHKANPVNAVAARAAGRLALGDLTTLLSAAGGQEHERAAGAWQAEWVSLPSALVRTAGAVARLAAALDGLEVDADRARHNLDVNLGLTASEALATALIPSLGRPQAQRVAGEVAAEAARTARSLADAAADHPEVRDVLDADALAEVLDPSASLRNVPAMIDAALETHRRSRGE